MKQKAFSTISIILLLYSFLLNAQIAPDTYWVSFTDKDNSEFSIYRPEEFLTERSIIRRIKQNIRITSDDLPVNKTYLDSLQNLGIKIHNVSKWLNGAAIISKNTSLIDTLHHLSFIKNPIHISSSLAQKSSLEKVYHKEIISTLAEQSETQLEMLDLQELHQQGLKGKGMLIAVLDAGFKNSQQIESLSHIWGNNTVLAVKDFVKDGNDILDTHSHGTLVLSIIAAEWAKHLKGAASEADYILVRTENGNSEYLVEEYNWISGAEFADSLGVDIINSSLGYTEFDDASQNHSYDDLDGKTTPITIGATIAARKGILVVSSAGNSGNKLWHYISAPGDADSILTIGAVDTSEDIVDFSSRGPTADNRIKPDVSAMGHKTAGQINPGVVFYCSGTSCSAPLITGLAACLWQEYPQATNQQILQAIKQSSHLYSMPNNDYGYGIPKGLSAKKILISQNDSTQSLTDILLYPNPTTGAVYLQINLPWLNKQVEGAVSLFDIKGRLLSSENSKFNPGLNIFVFSETQHLETGYYFIHVNVYGRVYSFPLIKTN